MCVKRLQTLAAGREPELPALTYDEINMQVVKLVMKSPAVLRNPDLSPLQTGWH